MNRRRFLAGVAALPVVPTASAAPTSEPDALMVANEIIRLQHEARKSDARRAIQFAQAVEVECSYVELFRSIDTTNVQFSVERLRRYAEYEREVGFIVLDPRAARDRLAKR